MFGVAVKVEDNTKAVQVAAEKANFENFRHAAASISKDIKSTLEKADGPSQPGTPPHTHRGAFLRRAVRYAANKDGAVIGPMFSIVGGVGAAHEFGGTYRGEEYPARPFAGPALERAAPRLASNWRGTIGQ